MAASKRPQVRLVVNPLDRLLFKNRLGEDGAFDRRLAALIYLDAAKRGWLPNSGYNELIEIILASAAIASQTQSKAFYDICNAGYAHLVKAGRRPGDLLSLSTTEYKAIREAVSWYVRALPDVEAGVVTRAFDRAHKSMYAA